MNTDLILWDQDGQPILLLINDWLHDVEGNAIGFVETDGAVYDLRGRHVAWFTGGIIRDRNGYCLAYSDLVEDQYHPPLPSHQYPPTVTTKFARMVPPIASVPSLPPLPRSAWSNLRPEEIFGQ